MSWSGPAPGGAPPYSQPPYQAPYGQPPYQQAPYSQPYQQSYGAPPGGPPQPPAPASSGAMTYPPKKKGNPVITRYAPPPGYKGPQPPPGAYAQAPYSVQGYQPPQTYPPQGYQQPAYPQQQGWQPQNWQQSPPQGYGAPGYSQPPQSWQPPAQTFGPQAYPPQAQPAPGSVDPSGGQWQQPPPQSYPPYGAPPSQDPNATPTPSHSSPAQGPRPSKRKNKQESRNASVSVTASEPPESHRLYQTDAYAINLGLDDWEQADFDGAIWPKANDPIDTNLSLGVITWHPANQATRALPSNFEAAEEAAAQPPPPKIGNCESVSDYFTCENAHEAFLNVRQTIDWERMRSDSIFYEFSDDDKNIINLEEVVAFRDRPDIPTDEPEPAKEEAPNPDVDRDGDWNVMDNLEQALASSEHGSTGRKTRSPRNAAAGADPPPIDQTQEDILAALGVTGSPKPVNPIPVPIPIKSEEMSPSRAYGEPGAPRHSNGYRDRDMLHGGPPGPPPHAYGNPPPRPPPPPEPPRSPSPDPWSLNGVHRKASPARSDRSQHTAAGSDFHVDDKDNDPFSANAPEPPNPRLLRSESSAGRKRSYDESENQGDAKHRQEDDYTPRLKRKQPRVAAAYGRR